MDHTDEVGVIFLRPRVPDPSDRVHEDVFKCAAADVIEARDTCGTRNGAFNLCDVWL